MTDGVSTPNLPSSVSPSEVIGNEITGGVKRTVRIPLSVLLNALSGDFVNLVFGSWAALAATAGTVNGQRAEVEGDAGTHTDPVTSATVANSGVYSYSVAHTGWGWLSDTGIGEIDTRVTTLEATVVTLANADTTEASARATADTNIANNLAVEGTDRVAGDATLQINITAEATSRATSDTNLQTNITTEASTRASADTTLTTNLATETSNRTTGDTNLQTNLTTEIGIRATADTNLSNGLAAETTARTTTDTIIVTNLSSETSVRTTADANLITALNAEIAARGVTATNLQANITTEQTNRISVDTNLQVQISNEGYAIDALQAVTGQFYANGAPLASTPTKDHLNTPFADGSYVSWVVGISSVRSVPLLHGIIFYIAMFSHGVSNFNIDVIDRPLSSPNPTVYPGNDPADVVVLTGVHLAATVLDFTFNRNFTLGQPIFFPLYACPGLATGYIRFFKISSTVSGSPGHFSVAQGQDAVSGTAQYLKGYSDDGTTAAGLSGNTTIAFQLFESVGDEYVVPAPISPRYKIASALVDTWASQGASPTPYAIPNIAIQKADQPALIDAQAFTADVPTRSTITGVHINLGYNYRQVLPHQEISNVVVVRQSDSAVLVEGVDYIMNYVMGNITGILNLYPFAIALSYTYDLLRYDVVSVNPNTQMCTVTKGTERANDPGEWIPTAPSGNVPLFNVLISRKYGAKLIPRVQWRDFVPVGQEARHDQWLSDCHQALRVIKKKLRQSGTISYTNYSDSIGEQGFSFQTSTYPSPGNSTWYVPGGPTRDNIAYFVLPTRLPNDLIATIPVYDTGDGGGAVHIRTGWNWRIIEELQAGGCTVNYHNLGIGGTDSSNAFPGGYLPMGLWPDRLAALDATAPDIVAIGFGMNELGFDTTYANIVQMIQHCQGLGADVLVWGVPYIAGYMASYSTGFKTMDQWRFTNDQLMQAAIDCGAAYVPFQLIADPSNMGGLGIDLRSTCASNSLNHPGYYELTQYGKLGAKIIKTM